MRDLRKQVHDYVESTIERVDMDDVVAAASADQAADPKSTPRLRPVWVAAGAAFLALLLIGVPLLFLGGGDSPTVDQTTSTAPATSTTPPTTQSAPTTAAPPAIVESLPDIPLGEAVPGFTDALVMFTTPIAHYVLRWEASNPRPEVVLTAGGSPVGLDVSGGWLAEIVGDGDLLVYPVPTVTGESATHEVVASDVESAIWHDTEAGHLAYLACPDPSSGTAALFTLDNTSQAAEPTLIRDFDQGCMPQDPFLDGYEVGDVWLERWGNNGGVAAVFNGDAFEQVRIAADGTELPGAADTAMLPEGPGGKHVNVDEFIASDEMLRYARWSPDGTRLALLTSTPTPDDPTGRVLRVVDTATRATIFETPGTAENMITTALAWSSDSRIVIYHSWQQPTDLAEGLDDETGTASLGFYDTATNTITTIPLDGFVDEIRIP